MWESATPDPGDMDIQQASDVYSIPDKTLLIPDHRRPKSAPPGRYHTFPSKPWSTPSADTSQPRSTNLKTEPNLGKNPAFIYVLACFATIGGLLFGYDTGIVSGSMLLIQPYFNLSTVWEEAIVSGTIGAAAFSALLAGWVCDRVGRRVTIMLASVIFTLGAGVMGAAPDKEVLLVGRVVVGIGIGFASMTVPVYVAESAPHDIRGRLVTLNQLFITIGILISSVIAGAFSEMKDTGWRYMLGLAGVPGVIQFLGFIYLPESPRWLVSKGRDEEARQVLRRIRGHDDIEQEIREITEAEANKERGFALSKMLRTPHVRRALIVGCGLQLFQQLSGINTVIYYSATILKEAGFHATQAIWLVCIPFAVNFLATFIGIAAVERFGRRALLICSFIGIIVALVVLSTGFWLQTDKSPAINSSMPVVYPNNSKVTDECQGYTVCDDCVSNDNCGYCYDPDHPDLATCLLAYDDDDDNSAAYGRCSNETGNSTEMVKWTYGYCPTSYGWMAVLGLALFVLSFAPGLGPMPWTINSEIYPMWARGTGVALATMFNWLFNLAVSFTFLTLLETITKYGTFLLFTGVSFLGLLFTVLLVPETKNKTLEEMEEVFMTSHERQQRLQQRQRQRQHPHLIDADDKRPNASDTEF